MMGRVAWLPIFLILVVSCQGLDVTTTKGPTHLSGVNDMTFDGNITTATTLNPIEHAFKQAFDNVIGLIIAYVQEARRKSATCHRNMTYDITKEYETLELMRDQTLNRDILCDTKTDGGGWIVIQRRTKGDVDFHRTWDEYKNGFGSPPGDFWLGNEAIHNLTSKDYYELRIDLNFYRLDQFAVYSSFRLENEADNYRLRLGSYSGTLDEYNTDYGLSVSNGAQFSTLDRDNDPYAGLNCADVSNGAWWYEMCTSTNLNAKWGKKSWTGLHWHTQYTFMFPTSSEMKIRLI